MVINGSGIKFPSAYTGIDRYVMRPSSGGFSVVTDVARTPGFNGNGAGGIGLTLKQEFYRILTEGVARAFPRTIFNEYSILFDTLLELESQGYRSTAALGALMHFSMFYLERERLSPNEVLEELFLAENKRYYAPVIRMLAEEGFPIPLKSTEDEDALSQIIVNYKNMKAREEQLQPVDEKKIMYYMNLSIIMGSESSEEMDSIRNLVVPSFLKADQIRSLGGRKNLERSQEIIDKMVFLNFTMFIGMILDLQEDEDTTSLETLILNKYSESIRGVENIVKQQYQHLPMQIRDQASQLINGLMKRDFDQVKAAAFKINQIIHRPLEASN